MNNGILTQAQTPPTMPYGLLGRPTPVPMPDRTFHSETTDWYGRVIANGGAASDAVLIAVDRFVRAIYAGNIRDRFWRLNLLAGDNLAAAAVPLLAGPTPGVQYGTGNDSMVNIVSGDYTLAGGLTGNAASKYINTGVNAFNLPILSNGLHLGAFAFTTTVTSGSVRSLIGVLSNVQYAVAFDFRNTPATFTTLALGSFAGSPTFPGLFLASLCGTNARGVLRTSDTVVDSTTASTSDRVTGNENLFALSRNNSTNAPGQYWGGRMGCYSFGPHMTASQSSVFYAALTRFHTDIGRS